MISLSKNLVLERALHAAAASSGNILSEEAWSPHKKVRNSGVRDRGVSRECDPAGIESGTKCYSE